MGFILDNDIKEIAFNEKEFPEQLKQIKKPPKKLFYRGSILLNKPCFAIVGTRKASDYGKTIAFDFAKTLSQAGLTIVSGMALGIDSAAHKGALAGKGKTIAVLASGLSENLIYPQENLTLAKEILDKNGALISEKNKEPIAFKNDFLERNRIIAGLSVGVLIVECPLKSGALNTAAWAKKQKKKVFAVPGNIYWQNAQGPHLLMQKGAFLVQAANDILKEIGAETQKTINDILSGETKQENIILQALKKGPLNVEEVIEKTNLSPQEAAIAITGLEAENKIKSLGGNVYGLNR